MPNNIVNPMIDLGDSNNAETMNLVALPSAGELGQRFTVIVPTRAIPSSPISDPGGSKSYQIVLLDSSITTQPTRGMIAYWKDKARYIVSNEAGLGIGNVAGVIKHAAPTLGRYITVQFQGPSIILFKSNTTSTPDATGKSVVTDAGTSGLADAVTTAPAAPITIIGHTAGVAGAVFGAGNDRKLGTVVLNVPETT